MEEYEEAYAKVRKVIQSCETKAQLKAAFNLLMNYFYMFVFKAHWREYHKVQALTSSPLYDFYSDKEKSIDNENN